jgi:hypothetical protein
MMELVTSEFVLALKDYHYLIDRSYPHSESLKLTGNRYMLNKMQRILLSRGIFRTEEAERRIRKKVSFFTRPMVYIDGYNVLFTIGNYLLGRPVFISNDTFLRDAGEIHGKIQKGKIFSRSLDLLMTYLEHSGQNEYILLLDQPVTGSDDVRQAINRIMQNSSLPGEARTVPDPDEELIRLTDGMIATSDSEIIDQADIQVIDIAFEVLTAAFRPLFINLSELLVP